MQVNAGKGLQVITRLKVSGAPMFGESVTDVAGYFIDPPDVAVSLSPDETSRNQASAGTRPRIARNRGCRSRKNQPKPLKPIPPDRACKFPERAAGKSPRDLRQDPHRTRLRRRQKMRRTTITITQTQARAPSTAHGRIYHPADHRCARFGASHALCDDCETSLVVNAIEANSIRDVPPRSPMIRQRGAMDVPQRICSEMLLLDTGTVIIPPEGVTSIWPTSTQAGLLQS